MIDLIHNTIIVSKILRYVGNYSQKIKKYIPYNYFLKQKYHLNTNKNLSKSYFSNKLSNASFKTTLQNLKIISNSKESCRIIKDADNALYSTIEILGGQINVSNKINWHKDFKANFTWRKKFYKDYKIVNPSNQSDIKTVWELSRCHHLLWLGEAYLITKDDKYVTRLIETIDDWIEDNPYNYSINWTCSMEVAIRAVNWIYAVNMVSESDVVTVKFLHKLFLSLFQHGNFIYTNLENDFPFSANHYASNIVGLLFVSYLFTDNKYGKKWNKYALNAFLYEVRTQILPSGFHFERSVSYHRLMTELFLYSYVKIKQNNPEYLALDITARIKSMVKIIDYYTKPNGLAPIIGDNDNGRFLPFVRRNYQDHRYLLSIASNVFNQEYCNSFPEVTMDSLIMSSNNQTSKKKCSPNDNLVLLDDTGLCILRNKSYQLSFINTGISKYKRINRLKVIGTHTHQDSLSIEISKNKSDFIIDPGSYTYTSNIIDRNYFRSTIKHNTLSIDKTSQYELADFFTIKPNNCNYQEPEVITAYKDNNNIYAESSFVWHLNKPHNLITHCRSIELANDSILLKDSVNCTDEHHFEWNFNLNYNIIHKLEDSCIKLISPSGDIMHFHINCDINYTLEFIYDFVSPSYGIKNPSTRINISIDNDKPFEIFFNFK